MSLITIRPPHGEGQSAQDGVIEALVACHERIRRFSGLACRLATAERVQPGAPADAARDLVRYFATALPLHVTDEDLSITPRLRAMTLSPAVCEALRTMTAQHVEIDRLLEQLVPEWRRKPRNRRPGRPAFSPRNAETT
jgi:hypothetical protein